MSDPIPIPPKSHAYPDLDTQPSLSLSPPADQAHGLSSSYALSRTPSTSSASPSPGVSRAGSFSNMSSYQDDDDDQFPPLDRLTVFDLLENLALPQRLEKLSRSVTAQTERVRRQQQRLKATGLNAKDRVVDEWRRRVPTPPEELDKYKKRVRESVDRLGKRWNDSRAVTAREKMSFIAGVLNIFISGYLIGAYPEVFHWWYTAQLLYFMPIRFYTYHKKGYHYFLADLCYFVNLLLVLSIWVFPNSKRLFISTYCLAFGNNAIAIAMWRNSLVFHSLDKVTSLFIHIMPCVTLHCLVHLLPTDLKTARFPAVHTIQHSPPTSPEHYTLRSMMIWATVPYAVWQLSYHFLITVRRREKIAAGRPTSFTWLRRSYGPTLLGRLVLSLPPYLQEPAFMLIQYSYALLTMVPCPAWFWYRWASAGFLMTVFVWSVYNGATYYIDVFGRRFEKELERMRREMRGWEGEREEGMTPGLESDKRLGERSERRGESEAGEGTGGTGGTGGGEGPRRMEEVMDRNKGQVTSSLEQLQGDASGGKGVGNDFNWTGSEGVRQRN